MTVNAERQWHLPLLAALDSPSRAFGPYASMSLGHLCREAAAAIRELETNNKALSAIVLRLTERTAVLPPNLFPAG